MSAFRSLEPYGATAAFADAVAAKLGAAFPALWSETARDAHGRLVAEYGEASGHAHAIRDDHVIGFRAKTAEMAALAGLDAVLVGGAGAVMRHEYPDGSHAEHDAVILAPGAYLRAIQVDEEDEVTRREAD